MLWTYVQCRFAFLYNFILENCFNWLDYTSKIMLACLAPINHVHSARPMFNQL